MNKHIDYLVTAILNMIKDCNIWIDAKTFQIAMDTMGKVEAIKFLRSHFSMTSDTYNAINLLKDKGATITWPEGDEPAWLGLRDAKDLVELLWALKAFGNSEHMASMIKEPKYFYGRMCRKCGVEFDFNEITQNTYEHEIDNPSLDCMNWEGHKALCIQSTCPSCL